MAGDPHVLRVLPRRLASPSFSVLFMVIETFRNGDALSAYRRFRDAGPRRPEGVEYVGSWIEAEPQPLLPLMETDDVGLLQQWVAFWVDLVDFEIVPVATPAQLLRGVASSTSSRRRM